jgi:RNA polymerase sigma factor (sigma-70 family)
MVYSTALDVIARRSQTLSLDEVVDSKKPPLLSYLDSLSPDILYEKKELLALVQKAIDVLPPRRRSAVLYHLQGLSLEETAVYLGESLNAVRHLLYRGLDDLKNEFSALSADLNSRSRKKTKNPLLELKRT